MMMSLENAIEQNPQEMALTLPEGSAIQNEAIQAIDGGKDAEVRNDVVEDYLNNYNEDDWLSFGKHNKVGKRKERLQNGLDEIDRISLEDMRNISEMGNTDNPYMPERTNDEIYGDDYKALASTKGNSIIKNSGNLPAVSEDNTPIEVEYEIIDSEVDNDETIPPEKKEEVKKERKEAVLAKRNPINLNSLSLESSNEDIVKPDVLKAGMQKGSAPSILGNVGSSTLKSEQIKADKEKEVHVDLPRSSASMSTEPVAYENDNSAVSMKNTAHQYGNEGAFARKSGMLGSKSKGNIQMGKGMPTDNSTSPRSSGVLKAPNVAEDTNNLTLKDLIIKKSSKWPNRRLDKDGYLIVVRDDGRVFINRQPLENFTRDNPRKIKELRKIVMEN